MALTLEQQTAIRRLADLHGIPQAFVLGIVEKESNGNVFWKIGSQSVPPIRPEGHYFYKYLSGLQRTKAVRMDLASPKSGGVHVPAKWTAVYAMFQRMIAIDRNAAYMSISMGIGQVMGANHEVCGYKSAEDMFKECTRGVEGQVTVMLKFIVANPKMLRAAQTYDYVTFAKGYNGPGYKKNRYDTELKAHVERWQGKTVNVAPATVVTDTIKKLGFDSVEKFQENYGLNPDGLVGPLTRNAVQEITKSIDKHMNAPIKGALTTGGIGGLIALGTDGISKLQDMLNPFRSMLTQFQNLGLAPDILRTVALILVAGAVGYGLNYWFTTRNQIKVIRQEA